MSMITNKHIYYDDEYKTILYRGCGYAIPPRPSMARHLRNLYGIKGQDLNKIIDYIVLFNITKIQSI